MRMIADPIPLPCSSMLICRSARTMSFARSSTSTARLYVHQNGQNTWRVMEGEQPMKCERDRHYRSSSWLDPRVEIRPSPIDGKGLFASAPIGEGETVVLLGGIVISDQELAALQPHSSLAIGEGLNLMQDDADLAQFGNHSCDPNLWMMDEVTLGARRAISTGEELTVDYAVLSASADWQMPCRCQVPLCRATIRGDDWRLPELQQRYQGHFSPFINERIRRAEGTGT